MALPWRTVRINLKVFLYCVQITFVFLFYFCQNPSHHPCLSFFQKYFWQDRNIPLQAMWGWPRLGPQTWAGFRQNLPVDYRVDWDQECSVQAKWRKNAVEIFDLFLVKDRQRHQHQVEEHCCWRKFHLLGQETCKGGNRASSTGNWVQSKGQET